MLHVDRADGLAFLNWNVRRVRKVSGWEELFSVVNESGSRQCRRGFDVLCLQEQGSAPLPDNCRHLCVRTTCKWGAAIVIHEFMQHLVMQQYIRSHFGSSLVA